jgi:iron complex outermembrane recepter protein
MKFIIHICLVFCGLTFFNAQNTFNIHGKVIDFHDKVPLSNTSIKIGNYSATSDENGNFTLNNVNKGTYTLTANHPNCDTFTEKIEVNKDLEITLNLEHHIADIETAIRFYSPAIFPSF